MHFPCIRSLLFNILVIFELLGDFLIVSFFPFSLLFTLVMSMAPKRKSTLARNPLHSDASSSSNSAPFSLWFCDDDAHKAFSENFSRRGIHSEHQVILADFTDTDLPTIIHIGNGNHCVTSRSLVLSCLSRSFTLTCTRLIVQYLFSLFMFEVRTFLSHLSLLWMCFGFLG